MIAPERALALLLRVAGVGMLAAVGAVFMPFSWMVASHHAVGMGELPDIPVVHYLTRTVSALYVLPGALCVLVSFDVQGHRSVIRLLGWFFTVFGAWLIPLNAVIGMPLLWTLTEGPSTIVFGVLLLVLQKLGAARPSS